MFCTHCASQFPDANTTVCTVCGAVRSERVGGARHATHSAPPRARRFHARLAGTIPLLLVGALLVGLVARSWNDRRALAAAYDAGQAAFARGDFAEARRAFDAAGSYEDAEERRVAADAALAPAERAFHEAVARYRADDLDGAAVLLLAIAHDFPVFQPAADLLVDVRGRQLTRLMAQAERAGRDRDWLTAERALAGAAKLQPYDAGIATQLRAIQAEHAPVVFTRDGNVYVSAIDGSDERLVTDTANAAWPAWSPDRTRIAFVTYVEENRTLDGKLYVINADGTGLRLLAGTILPYGWPVWSPDGAKIAFVNAHAFDRLTAFGHIGLWMVDLQTGALSDLTADRFSFTASLSWSPDSQRIAFVDRAIVPNGGYFEIHGGDAMVVDIATKQTINLTRGALASAYWVNWAPGLSRDRFLVITNPGESASGDSAGLYLLEGEQATPIRVATSSWRIGVPVWSPDGSQFAFLDGDTRVTVWRDGLESWIDLPTDGSSQLSWSPDGGTLFVPAANTMQPSYALPVGDRFGEIRPVMLAFDTGNGPFGAPQWSPRQIPPAQAGFAGTGLDPSS